MANNQRIRQAPGKSSPFVTLNPQTQIANRAPTVHDMYEQSTLWVYPAANSVWCLTSYAAGQAIWTFLVSAAGNIDTLTGNDAVAVGPLAGNVNVVTAAGLGLTFTGTPHTLTLGGTLSVAHGGTGDTSFTAYSVICGGTTSTGNLQNVSGVGTAGQVLTSNGAGALPTWQSSGGGSGNFTDLTVDPGPVTFMATGNGNFTVGSLTYTGAITMNTNSVASSQINAYGTGGLVINAAAGGGQLSLTGGLGTGVGFTAGTLIYGSDTGDIQIGSRTHTGDIYLGVSVSGETIHIGDAAAANVIDIGHNTAGNITNLQSPITSLPGPIYIYTGAGAPGAGLAIHAGDLYINTTPTGATDRMFIATGAGTWTNFTCAA